MHRTRLSFPHRLSRCHGHLVRELGALACRHNSRANLHESVATDAGSSNVHHITSMGASPSSSIRVQFLRLQFPHLPEMDDGSSSGVAGLARQLADWTLEDERCGLRPEEMEYVRRFHRREPAGNQCTSVVAQHVKAPVQTVWSLVRRFDQPQLFKPFVKECVMKGNIEAGSIREVRVQSGLAATRSTERLDLLDDNEHIMSVKFVGGDHLLKNYSSILTVHPEVTDGCPGALVIESFVVDVPETNSKDDICYFIENLLRCNLRSLADVSERSASIILH